MRGGSLWGRACGAQACDYTRQSNTACGYYQYIRHDLIVEMDPVTAELLVSGWEAAGSTALELRECVFEPLGEQQVAAQQQLLLKRVEFSRAAWERVYTQLF